MLSAGCRCMFAIFLAPDVYKSKLGEIEGYSYNVDWWSLAVTLYELLRHKVCFSVSALLKGGCLQLPAVFVQRPFKITNETTSQEAMDMYIEGKVSFSSGWSEELVQLLLKVVFLMY